MWTPEEGDGRYRVLRRLGLGGTAEVVLAHDTVLDRYVALKRVHTAGDTDALKRLKREATVGASITHPNLVGIYDVCEKAGGEVVIVMEFVAGDTLQALIQARGGLGAAKTLSILVGVAAALDAVHARGIVHRDVKPANILLGIDGSVKLADLGIAAVEDRTLITNADRVVGTFRYMAPEQLAGAPAHPAIDIYALAAVAFEALSGKRAHPEQNPLALAQAIATRPPPDLRTVCPELPAAAAELLKRGMSSDPGKRPRTAGELVGRLRQALEDASTEDLVPFPPARTVPQPLPAPPREHPTRVAVASGSPSARGPHRRRIQSRLLPILALLVCLAAAGSVVAAFAAGGKPKRSSTNIAQAKTTHHQAQRGHQLVHHWRASPTRRRPPRPTSHPAPVHVSQATAPPSGETTSAASNPPSGGSSSVSSPGAATPADVVQAFYEAAASHNYVSAWNLADENMRSQLDGFGSFEAEMSVVRAITFHQAQTVQEGSSSATVSLNTTAVLTDRTQDCTGTVQTVRTGSGQWMLDHISISCVAA